MQKPLHHEHRAFGETFDKGESKVDKVRWMILSTLNFLLSTFSRRVRKERELNPQGTLKNARPASNRLPSPFGWPFRISVITSTRNRTQNTPLEAEHDFHFTIEANTKRKARDSNPHGPKTARFSKPARQALSGYLPSFSRGPFGN